MYLNMNPRNQNPEAYEYKECRPSARRRPTETGNPHRTWAQVRQDWPPTASYGLAIDNERDSRQTQGHSLFVQLRFPLCDDLYGYRFHWRRKGIPEQIIPVLDGTDCVDWKQGRLPVSRVGIYPSAGISGFFWQYAVDESWRGILPDDWIHPIKKWNPRAEKSRGLCVLRRIIKQGVPQNREPSAKVIKILFSLLYEMLANALCFTSRITKVMQYNRIRVSSCEVRKWLMEKPSSFIWTVPQFPLCLSVSWSNLV